MYSVVWNQLVLGLKTVSIVLDEYIWETSMLVARKVFDQNMDGNLPIVVCV